MAKYVVTISRQFGSMGRSIAKKMSEILEVEFLDRDIVEETSKRMGLPVSVISQEEEDSKGRFFRRLYPLGVGIPSLKDEIFEVQKSIIRDFADKDSCIIVGRCADYILKDYDNLLSVYVYAPDGCRVKNCTDILGMSEKEARRMMKEVDAARENYHKLYVPNYENPFSGRSICMDSSYFGIDQTAEVLSNIVRARYL